MRILAVIAVGLLLTSAAFAQPRTPQAAPYKPVAIALPKPVADEAFDVLRKQVGEAAQRKDRAALTHLIVPRGFFWLRDARNVADKRRTGFDVLAAALGFGNKEGAGWEILASYTDDPTASPVPGFANALCAPAEPAYDRKAFADLLAATKTDVSEWGYPVSDAVDIRAVPQANAPVVERLGLTFVRMMREKASVPPSYLLVAAPSGKTGYVSIDSIGQIGNDQICYVKDGGGWKIGGYIGGGEP